MASSVRFHAATSIEDALEHLDQLGEDVQVLAGGTDVMIQLQRGEISPRELLHIDGIPGLRNASADERGLSLGALVTHEAMWRHPVVPGLESLREASAQVGGWQTQSIGTVVGNVVNASPAADLLPGLLVHEAVIHLARRGGERALPIEQFILGRRRTARDPREIATRISMAPVPEGSGEAFVKVGRRRAMEVSIVAVAVRLTSDPSSGTISNARIAVGAASAVPYRAAAAEQLLLGQHPSNELFQEAGRAALEGADPIDDVRASRRYRLAVLPRAVTQALVRSSSRLDRTRSVA